MTVGIIRALIYAYLSIGLILAGICFLACMTWLIVESTAFYKSTNSYFISTFFPHLNGPTTSKFDHETFSLKFLGVTMLIIMGSMLMIPAWPYMIARSVAWNVEQG